eukprot:scaffold131592_cov60-Attheya_sp.AAC.1
MFLNKNPNCRQGRWKPWVEVKKSNIVEAGWGLFASKDFKADEIISVYLGAVCQGKEDSNYQYRFHWLWSPSVAWGSFCLARFAFFSKLREEFFSNIIKVEKKFREDFREDWSSMAL